MHGWGSLRRWSTVIALACAAPALVAVGCGAFGGSDTSAGSEDAGSAAESGGADASLPSSDAGSEGGAVTFCDTVVGAAFCADFDRGDSGFATVAFGGGTVDIDDGNALDSGRSARAAIIDQKTYDAAALDAAQPDYGPNQAALAKFVVDVGAARRLSIDVDVRVDGYPVDPYAPSIEYMSVFSIAGISKSDVFSTLVVSPSSAAISANPSGMAKKAAAALPTSTFHLRVDLDATKGTLDLYVNTSPFITAAPGFVTNDSSYVIQLGMYAQPGVANGGIHFDNLVVKPE